MPRANGLHHLAISTADIKSQVAFFSDVLGMELVAMYWMHGVENAWHAFLRLHDHASIALVQTPDVAKIDATIGVTHAANPATPSVAGSMQHLALNVDTEADLLAMRDRIRSRGIHVFGPIDHGMCKSIYFAGLEHLSLEISTSAAAIDADAWIDPEVVALAGISADELARYRRPAAYAGEGGAVPQPPDDASTPRMIYPPELYQALLAMSDEEFTRAMSQPAPPVTVKAKAA